MDIDTNLDVRVVKRCRYRYIDMRTDMDVDTNLDVRVPKRVQTPRR